MLKIRRGTALITQVNGMDEPSLLGKLFHKYVLLEEKNAKLI